MINSFAMVPERQEIDRAKQLFVTMGEVLKSRLPQDELSPEQACIDSLWIFSQGFEQIPVREDPNFEYVLNQAYIYAHYNSAEAFNTLISLAHCSYLMHDLMLAICGNPMCWAANKDFRITRGLYEEQKFINIQPIWFNLALIRASDSFLKGFADEILDKVPAIKYLNYDRLSILSGPLAQAFMMIAQGQRVNAWREVNDDNIYIELIASDSLLEQRISQNKDDKYTEILRRESQNRGLRGRNLDLNDCVIF